MKYFPILFACAVFAAPSFAQAAPPTGLQASLNKLHAEAQKIARAATNQEKAKAWLALNHEAVKFAEVMNRAFPHSRIHGDRIEGAMHGILQRFLMLTRPHGWGR